MEGEFSIKDEMLVLLLMYDIDCSLASVHFKEETIRKIICFINSFNLEVF